MHFIDPRTDFAFKKIFGSPEGLEPLKSFIESVMGLEGEQRLASLELVNPYQPGHVSVLKRSYLDVKAVDGLGRKYLVEMQVEPLKAFAQRVVYNASKAYVGQLQTGGSYWNLTQVVAISVCDFVMFPDFSHYLSEHRTAESITGESYLDEVRFYFLELPKFEKSEGELVSALEKWTFFLRHAPSLARVPPSLDEEPFRTALHIAEHARLSPEEWEEYDRARLYVQEQQGKLDYALEAGIQLGLNRGKAEGLAQGLEQGKAQGLAQGKAEALLALLDARGLSVDEQSRSHILGCQAGRLLDRWLRRAIRADSVAEVLAEGSDPD
jgi:predicted transposase/invertase (TIGR01784 family)